MRVTRELNLLNSRVTREILNVIPDQYLETSRQSELTLEMCKQAELKPLSRMCLEFRSNWTRPCAPGQVTKARRQWYGGNGMAARRGGN